LLGECQMSKSKCQRMDALRAVIDGLLGQSYGGSSAVIRRVGFAHHFNFQMSIHDSEAIYRRRKPLMAVMEKRMFQPWWVMPTVHSTPD
jgi:hypothetical protein